MIDETYILTTNSIIIVLYVDDQRMYYNCSFSHCSVKLTKSLAKFRMNSQKTGGCYLEILIVMVRII